MLYAFAYIKFNNMPKLLVVIEMRKADFFVRGDDQERTWKDASGFFLLWYMS